MSPIHRSVAAPCAVAALLFHASASLAADLPEFEYPVPVAADAAAPESNSFRDSSVATDGAGTWVVAWSSFNDSMLGAIGGEGDVLFARSTDHGLSFSARAPLNSNAATDHSFDRNGVVGPRDRHPSVATDGNGVWIAAWSTSPGSIRTARSIDGGLTWPLGPNAIKGSGGDWPNVATDGSGTWVIVWITGGFSSKKVLFSRSNDDGLTWSEAEIVDPALVDDPTHVWLPRVYWSSGTWIASWSTGIIANGDAEAVYARSVDGALTWSLPSPINNLADVQGSTDYSPHFASQGAGEWTAVWVSKTASHRILSAGSVDHGVTWTDPVVVDSDVVAKADSVEAEPFIATGPAGTYLVVWTRSQGETSSFGADADILGSISTDGGLTWSVPDAVNTTAATDVSPWFSDSNPRVAYDPQGHWLAIWDSDNDLGGTTGAYDTDLVMALTGQLCGNGVVDPGEECDDGSPRDDGDCCNRTCSYDDSSTTCSGDADLCTFDRCDGAGNCLSLDEPRPACLAAPSRGSTLRAAGTSLRWSWKGEDAQTRWRFGMPDYDTDYALCLYGAAPSLVTRADAPVKPVPVTENCGESVKDCWKSTRRGFLYSDSQGLPNGVERASLFTRKGVRTKLALSAEGANVLPPALPVTAMPLRAQLVNSNDDCWEGVFSGAIRRNDAGGFSGKSD